MKTLLAISLLLVLTACSRLEEGQVYDRETGEILKGCHELHSLWHLLADCPDSFHPREDDSELPWEVVDKLTLCAIIKAHKAGM